MSIQREIYAPISTTGLPSGTPLRLEGGTLQLAGAKMGLAAGLLSNYSSGRAKICASGYLVRTNWTPLTSSPVLLPGSVYYLSDEPGKLTSQPMPQQLGIALDTTTLQVTVGHIRPERRELDAADFGLKEGATDNADALQEAILAAAPSMILDLPAPRPTIYRTLWLPPGTFYLKHPVVLPMFTRLRADNGAEFGCVLKADPDDFDLSWNYEHEDKGRAPAALIQSNTWAPDPTRKHRWSFNGSVRWPEEGYSVGGFWNCSQIENITLDGSGLPIAGLAIDSMAENSKLTGLWIQGCAGPGIWLTGCMTGPKIQDSSIWGCFNAVAITSNPWLQKIRGAMPDGNVGGVTSGEILFERLSGDANTPAYYFITSPVNVTVIQQKYESPWRATDNVVRFDVDELYLGKAVGANAGGRMGFCMIGGHCQSRVNVGPNAGQTAHIFCRIMRTNSNDHREWPKPSITLINLQTYHRNRLYDETHQEWAKWDLPPSPRLIGMGLPANALAEGSPEIIPAEIDQVNNGACGLWTYSNDTNERTALIGHDLRLSATALRLGGAILPQFAP